MRWILWTAAVTFLAIASVIVGRMVLDARETASGAKPHKARQAGNAIPVRTEKVEHRVVDELIGATAVTAPSEVVSSWVAPGELIVDKRVIVDRIHVHEGQCVKANELLFEIDQTLYIQSLKQQEQLLAAAEAELASYQKLRSQNAATALELRSAELAVELARFDLEIAKRDLERCKVYSLIDGCVGPLGLVTGEQIREGREFARIFQLDPIHVIVDFPQERIDDIAIGQLADVQLDSFPGETFEGKVLRIGSRVNEKTRVLPVIVEVSNKDLRIKAGVSGFVRLHHQKEATVLPHTAVMRQQQRAAVFRLEGQHVHLRSVVVGSLVENGWYEVHSGLAPGDEVVVYGLEELSDGDAVDTNWRRWAQRD